MLTIFFLKPSLTDKIIITLNVQIVVINIEKTLTRDSYLKR